MNISILNKLVSKYRNIKELNKSRKHMTLKEYLRQIGLISINNSRHLKEEKKNAIRSCNLELNRQSPRT